MDHVSFVQINDGEILEVKDKKARVEEYTYEEYQALEEKPVFAAVSGVPEKLSAAEMQEEITELNNNLEELQKKGTWEEILFSTSGGVKELSKSLSNFTQIAIVNENGSGDVAFSCETYAIEAFKRYTNRAQTYESGTTYVYCKYVDDTHINITGIGSSTNARIFGVY